MLTMLMMSSAWNGLEVIRSREKLLYQRTEYSIFPRPLFSQVVIWESAFVRPMKWWIQTRALFKLSSRNIQIWLLKYNRTTIHLYYFVALGCFAMLTLSAFLGNNLSHSVTTALENVQIYQIPWFWYLWMFKDIKTAGFDMHPHCRGYWS